MTSILYALLEMAPVHFIRLTRNLLEGEKSVDIGMNIQKMLNEYDANSNHPSGFSECFYRCELANYIVVVYNRNEILEAHDEIL